MKGLWNLGEMARSPLFIRIGSIFVGCIAAFFLGKHWSDESQQLIFFNRSTGASEGGRGHYVAISPNANRTFDIASLISNASTSPPPPPSLPSPLIPPHLASLPPPTSPERFGVVNENGEMNDRFDAGAFNPDLGENLTMGNEKEEASWEQEGTGRVIRVKKFQFCPETMSEYIPCLDNWEAIEKLNSTERGEKFERHCPEEEKGLNCLVPAPKNYKTRLPWPKSRDEVWFNNVPHTRLVEDKGGQNWITRDKDKFKFPGGGTQFIHGANEYLNQISEMVPDIVFGSHARVVLDVGCGVASFGAYLFSKNTITMSIAPKDVHENQIQFALERGVPAMAAAFATRRLLYPSQAFDLIHCSRCRINWTRDDGILLLEVNRMLRAGGYFAWAAQPVYKHEEAQKEAWKEMEDLTTHICWELVKKEGYIAIWRKPNNNTCYIIRDAAVRPPLCNPDDDPDSVWYVNLKACITRLPENGFGSIVPSWPARLHVPPQRLQNVIMDANVAKNELFKAETAFWDEVVGSYVSAFHWKKMNLRNVMDMRAGFGGFAAAMIDNKLDSWVMNVVPTSGPNTLPLIYDRGLIGVAHDWHYSSPETRFTGTIHVDNIVHENCSCWSYCSQKCSRQIYCSRILFTAVITIHVVVHGIFWRCEPFDTYPRTYDLLHAFGLFSTEQKRRRCNITTILLEMDRILRPGGRVYIRDSKFIIDEIQTITKAMGWRSGQHDTSEGPYASRKILICQK